MSDNKFYRTDFEDEKQSHSRDTYQEHGEGSYEQPTEHSERGEDRRATDSSAYHNTGFFDGQAALAAADQHVLVLIAMEAEVSKDMIS